MSHHSPAAEVCPEIEPRKKNMYWQSRAECLLHMFRPNVFPLQLNELCNQDCCPAAQATYCSSDLLPGQQLRVRVLLPLSMYQVALLVQLPRLLSSLLLQNSRGRLENTHTTPSPPPSPLEGRISFPDIPPCQQASTHTNSKVMHCPFRHTASSTCTTKSICKFRAPILSEVKRQALQRRRENMRCWGPHKSLGVRGRGGEH